MGTKPFNPWFALRLFLPCPSLSPRSPRRILKPSSSMQKWSDPLIAARKTLQYMSPEDMSSDPLFQQILTCSHSLAAIVGSGMFQDEPACKVSTH